LRSRLSSERRTVPPLRVGQVLKPIYPQSQDHVLVATANLSRRVMSKCDTNGLGIHGFANVHAKGVPVQIMVKDTWDVPDMAPEVLIASYPNDHQPQSQITKL